MGFGVWLGLGGWWRRGCRAVPVFVAPRVFPVIGMVDGVTGVAHWVGVEAVVAGRRAGRYVAVCGDVVVGSLTSRERSHCQRCAQIRGPGGRANFW